MTYLFTLFLLSIGPHIPWNSYVLQELPPQNLYHTSLIHSALYVLNINKHACPRQRYTIGSVHPGHSKPQNVCAIHYCMCSICPFGVSRCLEPGQSYSTRASGPLETPDIWKFLGWKRELMQKPKCICSTYQGTLDKVMMLTVMKKSIKKCQLSPTERQ